MARVRVRRPLIALVALLVAIVIGYTVRAATHHDHRSPGPSGSPTVHTESAPRGNLSSARVVVEVTQVPDREG